jgi:mannose-binding lectin 1
MINNGFTPDKDDYEFCTKMDNIVIPKEGFFGISAATGGLAGSHHVLACCSVFLCRSCVFA